MQFPTLLQIKSSNLYLSHIRYSIFTLGARGVAVKNLLGMGTPTGVQILNEAVSFIFAVRKNMPPPILISAIGK